MLLDQYFINFRFFFNIFVFDIKWLFHHVLNPYFLHIFNNQMHISSFLLLINPSPSDKSSPITIEMYYKPIPESHGTTVEFQTLCIFNLYKSTKYIVLKT